VTLGRFLWTLAALALVALAAAVLTYQLLKRHAGADTHEIMRSGIAETAGLCVFLLVLAALCRWTFW